MNMKTKDTNIVYAGVFEDGSGEWGLCFCLVNGDHESFFTEAELREALARIEEEKV